jgi:hypothetical protein
MPVFSFTPRSFFYLIREVVTPIVDIFVTKIMNIVYYRLPIEIVFLVYFIIQERTFLLSTNGYLQLLKTSFSACSAK